MAENLYDISHYQYNTTIFFRLPKFMAFDEASSSSLYGSHRLTLADANGNILVEDESSTSTGSFSTSIKSTQAVSASLYTLRVEATDALKSTTYNFAFNIVDGSQVTRDQTLIGTSSADILLGGSGDDEVVGGEADDYIHGNEGDDTLSGGNGNDTIEGGGGRNVLSGGKGDDVLVSRFGTDVMIGGKGDDTYFVEGDYAFNANPDTIERILADYRVNDVVTEYDGEGVDTIRASGSWVLGDHLENLIMSSGPEGQFAIGNRLDNNIVVSGYGSDYIDGGVGADTMSGGRGSDIYIVDNVGDRVIDEGDGDFTYTDEVRASVSYSIEGTLVENLTLTGTAHINGTGSSDKNSLVGNGGNNTLDGRAGADLLTGLGGNDTYVIDDAGDRVIEAKGGGNDTVGTLTSYVLAAGQEVETLRLMLATGSQNLNLTGNEFGQALVGNGGNNILDGGAGADVMTGARGNDTYVVDNAADRVLEAKDGGNDTVGTLTSYVLATGQEVESLRLMLATGSQNLDLTGNEYGQAVTGNGGANVLDGRLGNDVLTGGKGADTFAFSTALGTGNIDRVVDFASEDTLRLSKSIFTALAPGELAAGAFKTIGTGSIDADDRVLYNRSTGEVFYDADGSGKAAAVKFAVLDNKALLTHADILVA